MEASFTTSLDIEECLVGVVDTDVHICVADVLWTEGFWTWFSAAWGCLDYFE